MILLATALGSGELLIWPYITIATDLSAWTGIVTEALRASPTSPDT